MDVKDVMHTAVTTVTPETRVSTAYQVMTMRAARIRHLPVVTDEGILVGIFTDRDLRRAAASDTPPMAEHEWLSLLDKLRVRDIMTPKVVPFMGPHLWRKLDRCSFSTSSVVCTWCATTARSKAF